MTFKKHWYFQYFEETPLVERKESCSKKRVFAVSICLFIFVCLVFYVNYCKCLDYFDLNPAADNVVTETWLCVGIGLGTALLSFGVGYYSQPYKDVSLS